MAARLTMNTPISDLLSNQGRLALGAQRAGDRHHILLPLTGGELLQQAVISNALAGDGGRVWRFGDHIARSNTLGPTHAVTVHARV